MLIDEFQHDLCCKMQAHEPVSSVPLDSDDNLIALLEGVRPLYRIVNIQPVFFRLGDKISSDSPAVRILPSGKCIEYGPVYGDDITIHTGNLCRKLRAVRIFPEIFLRRHESPFFSR